MDMAGVEVLELSGIVAETMNLTMKIHIIMMIDKKVWMT